MSGIYIHVPFCAKRCIYCDFFSNTEMKYKEAYVEAIINELKLRREYIGSEPIETIYFGGGTPSQLHAAELKKILDTIGRLYDLSECNEITLEANPDDLTESYVASLKELPFNRISMGIQSFKPNDLRFLNRRHTAAQAIEAVKRCQANGFRNLSIDLMYGLPNQTLADWEANLDMAISLQVPHLSAYHLIYEEGTALYKMKEAGKISTVPEETSVAMFTLLIEKLTEAGFLHYEISNFGKPNFLSQHNSSYWTGKKYLGIGPAAHSYNGENRQWNISSLPAYLQGIETNIPAIEIELLDLHTRYNEFIITGLRTMWGIDLNRLKELFGEELLAYCDKQAAPYIKNGLLLLCDTTIKLSREGIFISDGVMSDLLFV